MPSNANRQPHRIAPQLECLPERIGEQSLEAEPAARTAAGRRGRVVRRWRDRRSRLDTKFVTGRLQEADKGILQIRGGLGRNQLRRRAGRQHASGMHQRNAVAALGLIHEMGGDEDGHAAIARQVDEQFPEPVARQRIDARGRLVENEHPRLVHHGDRQRQALANPER